MSGVQNLAFSCLATTVSAACQLKADHTISILLSKWRDEKKEREPGAGRYCAIPKIICPEVQGRLFNHTTDYAITVRRPAEEEGGNLSLEPRSLVCVIVPVQLFVRLLVSSILTQLSIYLQNARVLVRDNEGDLFATRNSIKVKCVIR